MPLEPFPVVPLVDDIEAFVQHTILDHAANICDYQVAQYPQAPRRHIGDEDILDVIFQLVDVLIEDLDYLGVMLVGVPVAGGYRLDPRQRDVQQTIENHRLDDPECSVPPELARPCRCTRWGPIPVPPDHKIRGQKFSSSARKVRIEVIESTSR